MFFQMSQVKLWVSGCVLVLLFTPIAASHAAGGEKEVAAEGSAMIQDGDIAGAKETALRAAQRDALLRVVGSLVSTESQSHETVIEKRSSDEGNDSVNRYQSFQESIVARSQGFIKTYKVVSERQDGGTLTVRIKAIVATGQIRDEAGAFGLLVRKAGNPSVAVVASKSFLDHPRSLIASELRAKGFCVIDAANTIAGIDRIDVAGLQPHMAAGVEVVIVVDGTVLESGDVDGQLKRAFVSLDVRAVRSDSGAVLAHAVVDRTNGMGASQDDAIKSAFGRASPRVSSELIEKIAQAWSSEDTSGRTIDMEVEVGDYPRLSQFRKRLGQLTGISGVSQKSFDAGRATVQVTYMGMTQALADRISEADFAPLSIRVQGVTPSTISIQIK